MDTRRKTIAVTGATGNQGGATARHLLGDGWHVRALVRDDTTPAAAGLAAAGAELIRGVNRRHRRPELLLPGRGWGAMPLDALWEHAPEAAQVFPWANERYFDTDLAPLREEHPDLMDFGTWLNRTGKPRLLVQLESTRPIA